MNKAFVREPDADARVLCPRCGSAGVEVGTGPLNTHVRAEFRARLQDSAWYCQHAACEVAYYNVLERTVLVSELNAAVYPYDSDAPICACFGFRYEDIEADANEGIPKRIRELLQKSQSPTARCSMVAANGQCCLKEVQRLYWKLRSGGHTSG